MMQKGTDPRNIGIVHYTMEQHCNKIYLQWHVLTNINEI